MYSVRKMEPVVTKYFCDGSDRKTPSLLERPTMVFVWLVDWLSAPTADGFFGRLVEIEHQQVNIWGLIRFAIWKNPKFVWNGRRSGWFSGFRVCLERSGWFSAADGGLVVGRLQVGPPIALCPHWEGCGCVLHRPARRKEQDGRTILFVLDNRPDRWSAPRNVPDRKSERQREGTKTFSRWGQNSEPDRYEISSREEA